MGYVLKVEPREFAERWVRDERKRRLKNDSSLLAQVP